MSAPVSEHPRIFARPVAVLLGEALLIAFALVILLAGMDKAQRERLESFQEVTAVGDRAFFQLPDELKQEPLQPVAGFRGQPLIPVSLDEVKIRDTKMIRMGRDDTGRHFVYSSREKAPSAEGAREAKDEKFFFLKLAPGEYLKVRAGAPGNQ